MWTRVCTFKRTSTFDGILLPYQPETVGTKSAFRSNLMILQESKFHLLHRAVYYSLGSFVGCGIFTPKSATTINLTSRCITAGSTVFGPFAQELELSGQADLSETLLAVWKWEHPTE